MTVVVSKRLGTKQARGYVAPPRPLIKDREARIKALERENAALGNNIGFVRDGLGAIIAKMPKREIGYEDIREQLEAIRKGLLK